MRVKPVIIRNGSPAGMVQDFYSRGIGRGDQRVGVGRRLIGSALGRQYVELPLAKEFL